MTALKLTLCFKANNGDTYSVRSVSEDRNEVWACRTRNGRRLRGRPKRFPLDSVGPMVVQGIFRQ